MAGYTAADIASALDYDPATGALHWKRRDRSDFDSDQQCNVWNAKYPGKPALASVGSGGYLYGKFMGSYLSAHRAAFACMTLSLPSNDVDHINGDKQDNSWANLREATRSENCANRALHKNNTSGHVGVSFDKKSNRWRARIKDEVIGLFEDWADAVVARKLAAELDGGFTNRHGS